MLVQHFHGRARVERCWTEWTCGHAWRRANLERPRRRGINHLTGAGTQTCFAEEGWEETRGVRGTRVGKRSFEKQVQPGWSKRLVWGWEGSIIFKMYGKQRKRFIHAYLKMWTDTGVYACVQVLRLWCFKPKTVEMVATGWISDEKKTNKKLSVGFKPHPWQHQWLFSFKGIKTNGDTLWVRVATWRKSVLKCYPWAEWF